MPTNTLTAPILRAALVASFRKLSPRAQFRNPVMFVVFVCSALTTALWVQALAGHGETNAAFIFWIALWLWFTLVFARAGANLQRLDDFFSTEEARSATQEMRAHAALGQGSPDERLGAFREWERERRLVSALAHLLPGLLQDVDRLRLVRILLHEGVELAL